MATKAEAWSRFEAWLAAMRPGDGTTVAQAVVETGMSPESVQVVFDALARADLFERHGDCFLRVPVRAA
jgi:hypothetical protein